MVNARFWCIETKFKKTPKNCAIVQIPLDLTADILPSLLGQSETNICPVVVLADMIPWMNPPLSNTFLSIFTCQHKCLILTWHLPRSLCAFWFDRLPWLMVGVTVYCYYYCRKFILFWQYISFCLLVSPPRLSYILSEYRHTFTPIKIFQKCPWICALISDTEVFLSGVSKRLSLRDGEVLSPHLYQMQSNVGKLCSVIECA